jgi:hypothetical protein
MGRFDATKATIDANIKSNGNQEITGDILNSVMKGMVDATDAELTELSEEVSPFMAAVYLKSLEVKGEYYTTNGKVDTSSNYSRLKPIKAIGTKLYAVGFETIIGTVSVRCLDADMNVIETITISMTTKEITLPNGTAYLAAYYASSVTFSDYCALIFDYGILPVLRKNISELEKSSFETSVSLATSLAAIDLQSLIINGEYYSTNGKIDTASHYSRLALIKVTSDSVYVRKIANQLQFTMRCMDVNMNVIGNIPFTAESESTEFALPSGTRYLGVNYLNAYSIPQGAAILMGGSWAENLAKNDNSTNNNSHIDGLFEIQSPNLFNPEDKDIMMGYVLSGSELYASAAYNTSGYIPVKENTTYYKASDHDTQFRIVNFYNSDKTYLSGLSASLISEFITPTNCAYVRISVYSAIGYYPYTQVAESSIAYTPYSTSLGIEPSSITDGRRIATLSDINNVLYGKKWAVVGDSFTAEFYNPPTDWIIEDGRYAGKSKVYGYIIGNRNNMRLQWLGVGGKTMATPASGGFTNSFSLNEYKNIDADVDYITIYLGINDSHHAPGSTGDDGEDKTGEIPLGTINDTTNATFYGAWNVVIPYLLENHPFAHIGIIVSNGCDTDEYRVAEIAIAKKYGIPYIDLNGDERTPFMLRTTNSNIPTNVKVARTKAQSIDYEGSNLHPNKNAHEFQADFIESWMRSL